MRKQRPHRARQTAKISDRQPQASPQAAITPGKGVDQSRSTTCKGPAAPAEDATGSATDRATGGHRAPQRYGPYMNRRLWVAGHTSRTQPCRKIKNNSPLLHPATALRMTPHVPGAQAHTCTTYITGSASLGPLPTPGFLRTMQPWRRMPGAASQAQQHRHDPT